jgi:predicted RNase H-like HicB family nuclease
MEYIAYLHKDQESDYGVSFPDFPGCVTAGSTLEEARLMATEALALHMDGMREDGDPIPPPSTLDDLRDDPAMKDAVAILVQPKQSERTVRINITVPESQLAEIDRLAQEAHLSRSAYLVRRALHAETSPADELRERVGEIRRNIEKFRSAIGADLTPSQLETHPLPWTADPVGDAFSNLLLQNVFRKQGAAGFVFPWAILANLWGPSHVTREDWLAAREHWQSILERYRASTDSKLDDRIRNAVDQIAELKKELDEKMLGIVESCRVSSAESERPEESRR